MIITPTLDTLRFMGARRVEITQYISEYASLPRSQNSSLTESLIARVYAQQLAELVQLFHEAGQTPLALEVALSIPLPVLRATALHYLGRFGRGDLVLLREALNTIQQIVSERERTQALIQLTPDLPPLLHAQVVALARQMNWGYGQVSILLIVAQHCTEPDERQGLLEEGFEVALQIQDPQEAAEALLALMPELDWLSLDVGVREVLNIVRRLTSEGVRARLLAGINDQVQAWLNTNRIPLDMLIVRLTLLSQTIQATLSQQVYQEQLSHAVMPPLGVEDSNTLVIPESLLRHAMAELKTVTGKEDWLHVIVDLLPLLDMSQTKEEPVTFHSGLTDPQERGTAIQIFVRSVPAAVVPDVLGLVPYLTLHTDRAELLISLISRLPQDMLDEALSLIYHLPEALQCDVFVRSAQALPEFQRRLAITHLRTLPTTPEQAKALMALSC